jgi:hypothetical protein
MTLTCFSHDKKTISLQIVLLINSEPMGLRELPVCLQVEVFRFCGQSSYTLLQRTCQSLYKVSLNKGAFPEKLTVTVDSDAVAKQVCTAPITSLTLSSSALEHGELAVACDSPTLQTRLTTLVIDCLSPPTDEC